jgi:hypothetical protein
MVVLSNSCSAFDEVLPMVAKFLSPIAWSLGFLACTWLWLRIQSPDHKVERGKMHFWIGMASFIAFAKYAVAWHYEIGAAWQNHPILALLSTFIVLTLMTTFLKTPFMRDSLKKLS